MIDWLDSMCRSWGRCTRWIQADTGEGYPSTDTIAKARDGLLTLREDGGPRGPHFREVRVGDALAIANAMKATPLMPFQLQAVMWAHYVARAKNRERIHRLAHYLARRDTGGQPTMSSAEYFRLLDRSHYFLASRIEPPDSCRWSAPKLHGAGITA